MRFSPARALEHVPSRATRYVSGITSPATTASPRPHAASTRHSSAPVIGFWVNITPATSGASSDCTTTPTLGRVNNPTRWRYVIAESELADHQISRSADGTSSIDGTLSSVRCWPAKLAPSPSSSTADERTASGVRRPRIADSTRSIVAASSPATASTTGPASATPGGTGRPSRMASPRPTAFEPKTETSLASTSGTMSCTRHSTVTSPAAPSTRTRVPSAMRSVASRVPTTPGMPYSRAHDRRV